MMLDPMDMSMEECQAMDAMMADRMRPSARPTRGAADGRIEFVYKGQDWPLIPKNITHVSIDPSIKVIISCAFSRCSRLIEVELHDGLEEIEEAAFMDCINLQRVFYYDGKGKNKSYKNGIPPSVRMIGSQVFLCCKKLANVELREDLKQLNMLRFLVANL